MDILLVIAGLIVGIVLGRLWSKAQTRGVLMKVLDDYDANIILNGLTVRITDEKAYVHVDADATVSKDELTKILQKVGF